MSTKVKAMMPPKATDSMTNLGVSPSVWLVAWCLAKQVDGPRKRACQACSRLRRLMALILPRASPAAWKRSWLLCTRLRPMRSRKSRIVQ